MGESSESEQEATLRNLVEEVCGNENIMEPIFQCLKDIVGRELRLDEKMDMEGIIFCVGTQKLTKYPQILNPAHTENQREAIEKVAISSLCTYGYDVGAPDGDNTSGCRSSIWKNFVYESHFTTTAPTVDKVRRIAAVAAINIARTYEPLQRPAYK